MSKRVAVVTGSTSGIGRAIALRLASDGFRIVLHGRNESGHSKAVAEEIARLDAGSGIEPAFVGCEFDSATDLDRFAQSAWDAFGAVDVWVNNAGGDVLTGERASHSLEQKLDYLWHADVRSTLLLSRIAGQRMKHARETDAGNESFRPAIINMGWDQAWQGMAGESGELFATTKGAIMAMTRSLAQSLAPNVRVNCIAPGWIKTSWGENASAGWAARAQGESLMGRWGTPEDVAAVAGFLAGRDAGFFSGQIVPVNGGFKFGRDSDTDWETDC